MSGRSKAINIDNLRTKLNSQVERSRKLLNKLNLQENRDALEKGIEEAVSLVTESYTRETVDAVVRRLKECTKEVREKDNRYKCIIERIFLKHYSRRAHEVDFDREEIRSVAQELGIRAPKNLGDVIYSFRYRGSMPNSVQEHAARGNVWIIRGIGRSRYRFCELPESLAFVVPTEGMVETKVPDSTPGVIVKYKLSDEQALLARLRYNRLIDVFTGVTCYSLQNHLRTTVSGLGQIEIDEIYIGIDRRGTHYILPVQAKGDKDTLNIVQIEQDYAFCRENYPMLVCRPIAAQFKRDDLIVLIEFEGDDRGVRRGAEKHYRLVASEEVTEDDLRAYQERLH